LVDAKQTQDLVVSLNQIKIISYKSKKDWNLVTKYSIGRRIDN